MQKRPVRRYFNIERGAESYSVFSTDDIDKILKAARTHKYGFYIQSLLYSGMRMGELLALRWTDVDFANDLIHIQNAATHSENRNVIKSTKTGKDRYIAIDGVNKLKF